MAFQKIASYIDITSSLSVGWNDIDVTAQGWTNPTGVAIYFKLTDQFSRDIGLRKKGSTDARTTSLETSGTSYGMHCEGFIGIDGDDIFQVYVSATTYIAVYMIGYFDDDAVFFTNAYDESLSSTATVVDIDISSETSTDTATGAIFEVLNSTFGSFYDFYIVEKGSSDAFYYGTAGHDAFGFISGVDDSEICQGKIETTNTDFYLVGYITAGAYFYLNAVDVTVTNDSAWHDITLTYSNLGGIIEYVGDNSGWDTFGFRRNGYTGTGINYRGNRSHGSFVMDVDVSKKLEGFILSSANTEFYLRGEFANVGGVNALYMFGAQF